MFKVRVIENFTLGKFAELQDIERAGKDEYGHLYVGDQFKCNKDMVDYLTGANKLNRAFVEVVEVIPVETPTPNAVEVKIKPEVIKNLNEKVKKLKTTKKKSTK